MGNDLINNNISNSEFQKLQARSLELKKKTQVLETLQSQKDKNNLNKERQLKEACAGFEAIFLNEMIKSMRNTLPGDSLFEDSNGMNIYKSMHDQHLADQLSKSKNSVGFKEFLYQELKDSI